MFATLTNYFSRHPVIFLTTPSKPILYDGWDANKQTLKMFLMNSLATLLSLKLDSCSHIFHAAQ